MSLHKGQPINQALRRFDHLATLDDQKIAELAAELHVSRADRGTLLLELGSDDARLLFLLDGKLKLVAGDGASRVVSHDDPAAMGPISRLRPSHYRVTAHTAVSYLMIEQSLLDRYVERVPSAAVVVEEALLAGAPNDLLDDSATHPLMFDVFDDINHGRIVVPSDPEIAIRVGRSLHNIGDDRQHLGEVLSSCPVLALKVVRAAMISSPRRVSIRGVHHAVAQLSVDETFNLAIQCILRESLRSRFDVVRGQMRRWWERTIRVAAICGVLARTSERFDPDFATLVGLLHSIAEPVMLGYADRHPDLGSATALDNVVHDNRAQLGRILSILWGLPKEIVEAATMCNHWGYDHTGPANYTDIMLVAQWHAMIGGTRGRRMPVVTDIPAFTRLGMDNASPETSLKIIEAANSAVGRTHSLLSA